MASLADKNLPQAAQDEINRITAQAQAGQISWSDANAAANKVRQDNGANFTVSAGGTTTFDDNSTISSYKTGSQTSGGKAAEFINDWEQSGGNGSQYYNLGNYDGWKSDAKYIYNPDKQTAFGVHPELAGQSVRMGGNTVVTFDKNGVATFVDHTGGTVPTVNASIHTMDSPWHQAAYQAALMGDWDLSAQYTNRISEAYGKPLMYYEDGAPAIDLSEGLKYAYELREMLGYNAEDYYNKMYDKAYGEGASAVWDATGGAFRTYNDLVAAVGKPAADALLANSGTATYPSGGAGGTQMYSGAMGAMAPAQTMDLTQYLKDMYAQDLQAQLAGLASSYEQSAAEIRAQDDIINNQYRQAMNDVAAQNDLQKMYMNELGLVNGLNTGATGQMALAQNMAYQGNLGNLYQQQMADINANNLLMSQLSSQYNNAVAQATANTNSALNNALYQEMLRQEEIAREDALAQQKLAQQAQDNARETALTWISNGVMPSSDVLAAAGMTQNEANIWYQVANGVSSAQYNSTPAVNTNPVPAPAPAPAPSRVDNEGLSENTIKALQRSINQYLPAGQQIAEDGKWGPATAAAAGGLTAREYYNAYEDYRAG